MFIAKNQFPLNRPEKRISLKGQANNSKNPWPSQSNKKAMESKP
jgi:hypothetical protein